MAKLTTTPETRLDPDQFDAASLAAEAPLSLSGETVGSDPETRCTELLTRAQQCTQLDELNFIMANETWRLLPYRQALLWLPDPLGIMRLRAISGLPGVPEETPFTDWAKRVADFIHTEVTEGPVLYDSHAVPDELAQFWDEWLPELLLVFPLRNPTNEVIGYLWMGLEEEPQLEVATWLSRLGQTYGYCLWSLTRKDRTFLERARAWCTRPRVEFFIVAALLATLFPVRQSALAPAEVVALEAQVIASPMDGVVKSFQVMPNQPVKAGQLLFTLDDTTLRNRYQVILRQIAVAKADAMTARQQSFADDQSKASLPVLEGKVAEKQAEAALLEEQLKHIEIRAPHDGIAVFGDINDWLGRPLTTGERVMLLADPKDAGVLLWLPVADAIAISTGAEMRMFLQTAPLDPLHGKIFQTSYQATNSPEGVSSYRLRARFEDLNPENLDSVRIGLKGTAKIYGKRAPLLYHMLRRPLATLRQKLGF